ncbi:MAG: insulinase family protein, partial [Planctomycetes bacterium]|nr:insulinase family protein [Planctomycetota bacterium]
MRIPHRLHVLENGLRLFVHEDHTSPIVTSQLVVHVGSARESAGRTGFAHLFEHMMFQGSGRVPEGQFFQRIQEAGGSLNANTSSDRTLYFEELPKDQLELALWMESDRLGWLLEALDQATLDNQRDVVLEERKQNYEQKPYGGVYEALLAIAFPREHPYSWPTIGSADDVRAATLEDVTSFFRRWYVPNNATLALAGDLEFERAVELVERHYGPIPAGAPVARMAQHPVTLRETRRVFYEDRVPTPQLNIAWPTVHAGHEDAPALDLLLQVLSANRSSVLDRAMTVDEHLASQLNASHVSRELAGTLNFALRPHEGVALDRLVERLEELLAETARRGVTQDELDRVRSSHEAALVRGLERVASRASVLALNDRLRGDADALEHDAEARAKVTPEQVTDALRRYLVDRPFAVVSCVPHGKAELALAGSTPAAQEPAPAPERTEPPLEPWVAPPIGTHVEPRLDHAELLPVMPESWQGALHGGATITSAPGGPLPLLRLRLAVPCGRMHQGAGSFGLASMT